ncbi:acetoin utilization deacetylase AcuC-like enzyme [Pedobacter psychrotolerans]|uniref:Acetoin utilization deacetylase AcuC-like enzyme n=1 Tax=Pedobacter psychrotolerans TaxID=1843235 RepID=A0A4R2H7L7_9SPHI|nr:histone deacetylase [Pedobacter psychrotolerans]TCO22433.1 acetoin utilization deacetylase AcuC-like enzyme [Pedobacter psychrotolerans]GGE64555.1 histone deacetylase [Pedobacter psychrotolerans]
MIKIAYHRIYAHPLPEGHRFPMLKYELIPEQLLHEGIITPDNLFEPEPISEDIVLWTHQHDYWMQLRDLTLPAKEQRRIGFPLNAQLLERELRITRGTIDGAKFALGAGVAFNVAGGTHHSGSNWGEGFCMLNDQAIASNYLLNNKLSKSILIIDLDVHQGNGTAEIFRNEPRVFTFSMHGDKNFPFRKEQSDLDVPLNDGVEDEEYIDLLSYHLQVAFQKSNPDFVFYLSGVDVLSTDKLGKISLTKVACKERDRMVIQACKTKGLPLQISMGGGYSANIRDIVDAHCNTYKVAFDLYH